MDTLIIVLFICGAFLFGSIPTGYLLVKYVKHIDIREIGSGNIGSTNVKRAAGRKISLITQVGDILKGTIPVVVAMLVVPHLDLGVKTYVVTSLTALAAIAGHNFTPFLRFRGGKGVNTTLGTFILITPFSIIAAACVFFLLRFVISITSIRSIAAGVTLAVATVILSYPLFVIITAAVAGGLIVVRHIDNIKRLIAGTES